MVEPSTGHSEESPRPWSQGQEVLHRESCESTQEELRRWARRGAPHGSVVLADRQTRGRGRQARSWSDPGPGNLFVSVLLLRADRRMPPVAFSPLVGLGVAQTLEELGVGMTGLKWPNDVLVEGRKVAGILLEGGGGTEARVLVGLGLNLRRPVAGWGDLAGRAMALDEIGLELTREDFLRLWLPRLNAIWEAVCAGETSDLRAEWDRRSVLRRQPVRWQDSTGSSRSGTAGRLRKDGALEVVTDRGDSLALYAGDVHLLDGEAGEER